jgi:LuxR family transcriptional regulator, maltose regulon positive regulatory protein
LYEAAQKKIMPEYTHRLLEIFHRSTPETIQPDQSSRTGVTLSDRELIVLNLLSQGLSNKEIASRLSIELRTVKWHTGNIFVKLNVKNRTQAVARARDLNILLL